MVRKRTTKAKDGGVEALERFPGVTRAKALIDVEREGVRKDLSIEEAVFHIVKDVKDYCADAGIDFPTILDKLSVTS